MQEARAQALTIRSEHVRAQALVLIERTRPINMSAF
jgi:hypothetical protein